MVDTADLKPSEYKFDLAKLKTDTNWANTQIRLNKEPKEELTDLRDACYEALETDRMNKDKEF